MENPKAYGLPTVEEYVKLRENLWGRSDDAMTSISDGPQTFRRDLNKIKYQIHGVDVPNENHVERALGDYGYSLSDIDIDNQKSKLKKQIEMIPLGGGRFDILVNFLP